ncbi:SDR family oxidoreductase [Flaviaesturariibacter amylovorans]|uniref:SDR family oxidoreductase n=1 Tax=Flaviaesturariibacter amylovorans TaxID=1084520 RepID=A0ABP8GGP1_9BACT
MYQRKAYAVITGGSNGFGWEFAQLCAKDGYGLVLVARNTQELERAAAELRDRYSVDVVTLSKDLFEADAAFSVYEEVKSRELPVEILINNAGQGDYGSFADTNLQRDLDLVQLNVSSVLVLTKLFLKDMLAQGHGRILQVSSLLGQIPTPLMAVYGASKAFVLKFSEALAQELEGSGVTVTVLQPGASDTDFFHKAGAEATKEYQEATLSDPADVARDGYSALMSGDSRIISGAKNKMMAVLTNLMPDSANAANMKKQMQPTDARNRPVHGDRESDGSGNA